MTDQFSNSAIKAILHEYELAKTGLVNVIENVSPDDLLRKMDLKTTDPNCVSIQSILRHVCQSSYGYLNSIQINRDKPTIAVPVNLWYDNIADYTDQLDELMKVHYTFLIDLSDHDIEELIDEKKIISSWRQKYDIEQLLEHAIVHILRHRYQIESFIKRLL
ncbi:MAG: DinB family protein [Crocinitomix sp.]|nr:DinB family protein [Crocinitomix sp.]